jgi:hypothetical protein
VPDVLALLLTAADDAALREAVVAAGGFDRAIRTLVHHALRHQADGGAEEEAFAMVAVTERVYALAQRTRIRTARPR